MKFKTTLVLGLLITHGALADSRVTCQNPGFPTGMGSVLELTLSIDGALDHATMYLNDSNPQFPSLKTSGDFRALDPTYDEDRTPVVYFKWYGGAGNGADGGDHLKLIPTSMAIYDFNGNYKRDHTVFLGVIKWSSGQKIESYFNLKCSPSVTPTAFSCRPCRVPTAHPFCC